MSLRRYTSLFSCLTGGLLVLLCGALPATAATVRGTVRAQGAPLPVEERGGDSYGSRRYKFIERVDYEALTDFVVWIDLAVPAEQLPATRPMATVVQRDGTFHPRVVPVLVGASVEWANEDTIYHNVFSVSDNTPFDLGLYKSGEAPRRVKFETVGRVDVFCSIHTRMNCIVLVLPNPWFARADEHGRFAIPDVPPGTYKLKAWHERLPAKIVELTVPADGTVTADLVLGFPPSH